MSLMTKNQILTEFQTIASDKGNTVRDRMRALEVLLQEADSDDNSVATPSDFKDMINVISLDKTG